MDSPNCPDHTPLSSPQTADRVEVLALEISPLGHLHLGSGWDPADRSYLLPPEAAADLSSLFGIEWDEAALPKSPSALSDKASSWSLECTPPPEGALKPKKTSCRKTAASPLNPAVTCHAE